MKKIVLIAALSMLAACSQKTEEKKEVVPAPAAETPAPAVADSGATPGTYDVKMADGTMGSTVINADGTYVDTDAKGKEVKGKYARKDGKDCFDPDGNEAEMCWTVTPPAADGSFTATSPTGTTVTVAPKKG